MMQFDDEEVHQGFTSISFYPDQKFFSNSESAYREVHFVHYYPAVAEERFSSVEVSDLNCCLLRPIYYDCGLCFVLETLY